MPSADRRVQGSESLLGAFGEIYRFAELGEHLRAWHAVDEREGRDIFLSYPPLLLFQGVLLVLASGLFA